MQGCCFHVVAGSGCLHAGRMQLARLAVSCGFPSMGFSGTPNTPGILSYFLTCACRTRESTGQLLACASRTATTDKSQKDNIVRWMSLFVSSVHGRQAEHLHATMFVQMAVSISWGPCFVGVLTI